MNALTTSMDADKIIRNSSTNVSLAAYGYLNGE